MKGGQYVRWVKWDEIIIITGLFLSRTHHYQAFIFDLLNELNCAHLGIVLTQDLFPNHKVEACKIDDLTSDSLETLV